MSAAFTSAVRDGAGLVMILAGLAWVVFLVAWGQRRRARRAARVARLRQPITLPPAQQPWADIEGTVAEFRADLDREAAAPDFAAWEQELSA